MKSTGKETKPSQSELERWNSRFAGEAYHFGTEPNTFLAGQAKRLRPGMSALCVADGEGRNSVWLARQGLRVRAFDFSPVGVEKARRLARDTGVALDARVADINSWDWDEARYDLVVAIFFQFATPEERAKIFAGMTRSLASGGLLLLQGYTLRQLEYKTGGPADPARLYTEALLRESFAALEILHLAEHDETVSEGDAHVGMSALIDLVARKPQ
ncbi:MAG: class I SAM-dependent methyltransferase [Betaproteobacteria bacterium]|nr:class I SAM-dependent methyltransferase [Betaproteobacteria bacterium]